MPTSIGVNAIGPTSVVPERPDPVTEQPHPDHTPNAIALQGQDGKYATVDRFLGRVLFTQDKPEWNERFWIDGRTYVWYPDGDPKNSPFLFLRVQT